MVWPRWVVITTAAYLAAACGGSRSESAAGRVTPGAATGSDVITTAELREAKEANLYDFIRAYRPRWLQRARPTTMRPDREAIEADELVVYVDNARLGDVETLRQVTPGGVVLVRFLSPSEAHAEFGPGHLNGAIQVRTR